MYYQQLFLAWTQSALTVAFSIFHCSTIFLLPEHKLKSADYITCAQGGKGMRDFFFSSLSLIVQIIEEPCSTSNDTTVTIQ